MKLYRVWCRPEGDLRWRVCPDVPPMSKADADKEATRRFVEYTGWLYKTVADG